MRAVGLLHCTASTVRNSEHFQDACKEVDIKNLTQHDAISCSTRDICWASVSPYIRSISPSELSLLASMYIYENDISENWFYSSV